MKKKQIDLLDITILNILIENAELNNKQLSEKIGLSEGPTLVRVQNLWGKGILKSFRADINYEHLGYTKFYLIRAEVSDSEAPELLRRLHLNPYVVYIIEMDGSVDTILRIYLGIIQTKNLKAAKDELHILTAGIKGIKAVTFNAITDIANKPLMLQNTDIVK